MPILYRQSSKTIEANVEIQKESSSGTLICEWLGDGERGGLSGDLDILRDLRNDDADLVFTSSGRNSKDALSLYETVARRRSEHYQDELVFKQTPPLGG